MLKNIRNWNYEERLHYLNLPSLSYRQFRGDMLTSYQTLNGLIDVDATKFFDLSTTTHTRGHSCKLYKRYAGCDVRKNNLPSNVIEATSINDFKNKFDDYFKDLVYCIDLDL